MIRLVQQTDKEAEVSVCAGCVLKKKADDGHPCPSWEKRGLKCMHTRNGEDRKFAYVWVHVYGPKVRK